MGLVIKYLREEYEFCVKNNVRVRHTGDITGVPEDVAAEIRSVCEKTRDFTGMQVILALNYGGRDEIVRAVRRLVQEAQRAQTAAAVTEDAIRARLDNPDIPDPDLIIRTAGELRTSNFLLWEAAYSELYFSPVYWPDFSERDLQAALDDYARRERRFGKA
jgi:undecaprenyl diphosphate synthase